MRLGEIRQKFGHCGIFDGENGGWYPKKPFNIAWDDPRIPNSKFGPIFVFEAHKLFWQRES